jgi:hypothetical protein
VTTLPLRLVWEDLAHQRAHRLTLTSAVIRISFAGYSAFGFTTSFGLGRAPELVLRLTTVHDRDASNRCLPPNTLSTSTHTRLLPVHRHPKSPSERVLDRLRLSRPRNRTFHDIRSASADRPGFVRDIFPGRCCPFCEERKGPLRKTRYCELCFGDQPLTPLSPLSLRPVHFFPRCSAAHDAVTAARPFRFRVP